MLLLSVIYIMSIYSLIVKTGLVDSKLVVIPALNYNMKNLYPYYILNYPVTFVKYNTKLKYNPWNTLEKINMTIINLYDIIVIVKKAGE